MYLDVQDTITNQHVKLKQGKIKILCSYNVPINTLGHDQSPKPLFSMFIYILQGTKVSPHI